MKIKHAAVGDVIVVTLDGRLDLEVVPTVQGTLLKLLAEQPRGIVVDLAAVEAIDPICAAVFSSVIHPAARWPGTTVVLCRAAAPVAEVLASVAVPQLMAVCDTREAALGMTRRARPRRLQETFRIRPVADADQTARILVADTCERWQLAELVAERAASVAGMLVADVGDRSGAELLLEMDLRPEGLRIHVDHPARPSRPTRSRGEARDRDWVRAARAHGLASGSRRRPGGGMRSWFVVPVDGERHARR